VKLKDKVAIVTGSSRGIGKAIALRFAREGATVILAARTASESQLVRGSIYKTAEEIYSFSGKALPIKTDVSNEAAVEALVRKTVHEFNRVDILVNNAATNRPAFFKDMSLKNWDTILKVNLRGPVICTKAVLPTMMNQKEGHIITISSVVARMIRREPLTGLAYDVSKAAVNRFTRGLAEEVRDYQIAVNAIMPDKTVTEGTSYLYKTTDMADWRKPDVWGRYAVFVATQDPTTFTGKILSEKELKRMCSPGEV